MSDPERTKPTDEEVGAAFDAWMRRHGRPALVDELRSGPLTGTEAMNRAIRSRGAERIEKIEEDSSDGEH